MKKINNKLRVIFFTLFFCYINNYVYNCQTNIKILNKMKEIRKELQDLKEDLMIDKQKHYASRVGYIQQLMFNLKDK